MARAELTPGRLRCEYRENPLGIDETKPRLSWWLESGNPAARSERQTAYQLLVASSREALHKDQGDLWDSGKVLSDQTVNVEYAGKALPSRMECHWKVRTWDQDGKLSAWSASAFWTMGLLGPKDWTAKWIAEEDEKNAEPVAPLFRKTFTLPDKPVRAIAYVSSLGYNELYLNGQKVGKDVLAPQVSLMDRYVFYTTHDVSALVAEGRNCLGLWLADGYVGRFFPGSPPQGIVQLEIECKDDTRMTIASDGTWKTHPSHIGHIGLWQAPDYGGERFDCGRELPAWNKAAFDDAGWKPVRVRDGAGPALRAQMIPPTAVVEEISSQDIKPETNGVWLVDMGQMVTGWFEFSGQGAPGQIVTLDYWQWLAPDTGKAPMWNQRDVIVPDAAGRARFRNKFNRHTFRYVRIKGLTQAPEAGRVKAMFVATGMTPALSFSCANDLVNRIHQATVRTFLDNSIGGYISDCPERERAAYASYPIKYAPFVLQHFAEGPALLEKFLRDGVDAQRPDGLPSTCSPATPAAGWGTWPHHNGGSVYVQAPWQLYLHTGDKRAMTATRASAEKYLSCIESLCDKGTGLLEIRGSGWGFLADWYAVGPSPQGALPRTVVGNSLYILNLDRMGRYLDVLGDGEQAARYRTRADEKRRLFHDKYYQRDSANYGLDHMTYLALPLLAKVPPGAESDRVFRALEHNIQVVSKGHPTSGDGGTHNVLGLLSARNRPDLVYLMVDRRDPPSWGAMVQDGGSTIWEKWGTPYDRVDRVGPSAQNDMHSSRSHVGLAVIGEWFMSGLAGIQCDPAQPGFKHAIIRPYIPDNMEHLAAAYDSVHGKIAVSWRKKDGILSLDVSIPPNTTATLFLPGEKPDAITESGRSLADAPGVKVLGVKDGAVSLALGSGSYSFACPSY